MMVKYKVLKFRKVIFFLTSARHYVGYFLSSRKSFFCEKCKSEVKDH